MPAALIRIAAALLVLCAAQPLPARPAAPDPLRVEAAFQESLAAIGAGRPGAAIPVLLGILAADPALVRVRLELARAYYLDGDLERARREFLIVLSGDLPDPVRRKVLAYIRRIDSQRAFVWNLDFGLEINPEAGRSYDTDIVDLEMMGASLPFVLDRPDPPPVRARVNAAAEFQKPVGAGPAGAGATAFAAGRADLWEAGGSDFDEAVLTARAGLRFTWPQLTASVAPALRVDSEAGRVTDHRLLLETGAEYRTATGLSVFGALAGGRLEARDAARSGAAWRGSLGLRRSIGGRSLAGILLFAEGLDAEAGHASYRDLGIEIFASTEIPGGLTIEPSLKARRYSADEAAPFFLDARRERELGFDIDVTRNDLLIWGRYAPVVSLGASRRSSSIDAFSYTDRRLFLGLRREL